MQYPDIRIELESALESLSDRDYQEAAWVRKKFPPGIVYDELDYAVHFLFDDTLLSSNASAAIGVFLYDEREADAIRAVVHALGCIFDKYGTELSDEDYINKPEWDAVLSSAKAALLIINEKPEPVVMREKSNPNTKPSE